MIKTLLAVFLMGSIVQAQATEEPDEEAPRDELGARPPKSPSPHGSRRIEDGGARPTFVPE